MDRFARLCHWLADLGIAAEPRPASADASFRRYWRVALPEGGTRIVMDAPPEKEPLAPWLAAQHGLQPSLGWPAAGEWRLLGAVLAASLVASLLPGLRAYRQSLADGMTVRT